MQQGNAGQKEAIMRERFSSSMITVALAGAAVSVVVSVSITPAPAQVAVMPFDLRPASATKGTSPGANGMRANPIP